MWAAGQLGRRWLATLWVGSDLLSPTPAASGFPGELSESPDSSPHSLQDSESVGMGAILIFTKLSDSKRQPRWRIIGMRCPEARVPLLPLWGPLLPAFKTPHWNPPGVTFVQSDDVVQPCNFQPRTREAKWVSQDHTASPGINQGAYRGG